MIRLIAIGPVRQGLCEGRAVVVRVDRRGPAKKRRGWRRWAVVAAACLVVVG